MLYKSGSVDDPEGSITRGREEKITGGEEQERERLTCIMKSSNQRSDNATRWQQA